MYIHPPSLERMAGELRKFVGSSGTAKD